MRRHLPLIVAVAVILVSGQGWAQTAETGVLAGRVVDPGGAGLADAVVLGAQPDGSNMRTGVTGPNGEFRMAFLPPGLYQLSVQAEGFLEQTFTDIRVRSTNVTSLEIELLPTAVSEEITVIASAPLLDASTTEYSGTLTADQLEILPTSRTTTELLIFLPGVKSSNVWGGSGEQANSYQLDGVSVNQPGFGGDFLLPSPDWIEELEVKGLGAGAEYGNFQGGLINMVTRSGSNSLKGSVRLNYEDESLNSTVLDAVDRGAELDSRGEISADLGGAMIQDKLYYFVSAQQARLDTNIVDGAATDNTGEVVFLPVQEERTETKLFAKLNYEPTVKDRLSLVGGLDDVVTDNRGLNSYTAPEAAQKQESPSVFYNASWQRMMNNSNYFELKATGYDGRDDRLPLNGDIAAVQILGGNRNLYTNAVYTRKRDLTNSALSFSWDSYLDTERSNHHLKAGAEYDRGSWLEQRRRNGDFSWRPEEGSGPFDPDDPSTWGFISSDWGSTIRLDAELSNTAVFVQDYWDVAPWLTLSLGLRWGQWQGDLTPGISGGSSFAAVNDNDLAPRIGAIVDFAQDGEWIGKVHWGRYYQSLFALMFDRVEGGDVFEDTEYWDWTGASDPDLDFDYNLSNRDQFFEFFGGVSSGEQVGPAEDYRQPSTDQLVLGIEKTVGKNWRLGLTYVNRKWNNILALVDKNLDSNYTAFSNVEVVNWRTGDPVLDQNGSPLVLPTLYLLNDDILYAGSAPGLSQGEVDALTFDRDYVLTNPNDAERKMDQFLFTVDRRGAGWTLNASLVYTDLTGNFYTVNGYETLGGEGAGAFVRRNEQTNFSGDLQNFADWEAKLSLSGDLGLGFRGGLFYRWDSGQHYTPYYLVDRRNHDFYSADGEWFDPDLIYGIDSEQILLATRGDDTYESFSRLDLYLDKLFAFQSLDLVIGVDVFNVFNQDAVTNTLNEVNDPDFGLPTRRQLPRTFRLNASIRF